MTDYLSLASIYLEVKPDAIVKHRLEGDELVVIVDKGIAGSPKYRIPLSDLQPSAAVFDGVPGAYDLGGMSYRELQALAKQYDIPANQAKDDLIDAIEAVEEEE